MRTTLFVAAALTMALSGAAFAQQMPPGVKMANGAMADANGKALYTYDMDTMKGMSHCTARCAAAWPPLTAPADAKPIKDWTLIKREDGALQWAYKDKPLYTFARDEAGKAGTGESVPNWKLAK
jgi:predicted lipoprotein with Yx(FWY)xxD motif